MKTDNTETMSGNEPKPEKPKPVAPKPRIVTEGFAPKPKQSIMPKELNSQRPSGRLPRLVRCVRSLGVINGFRYWRLENQARKDPLMVERCYHTWMEAADTYDKEGKHLTAGVLRAFAKDANDKFHSSNAKGDCSPSPCSAWMLGELESLRNGIMQAHMKGAEHGDQVLMACMRAHHEAANQAIEKLGGEVVPLANLEALTQNAEATRRKL